MDLGGFILGASSILAHPGWSQRASIPVGGLASGPLIGLVSGLLFWLFVGLGAGGEAYLKHYFLRMMLWGSGVLPWHAVRLCEDATECILLAKVGGGYRFIHPLLQAYFASLSTNAHPPLTRTAPQAP
jgi:hypothetical protein